MAKASRGIAASRLLLPLERQQETHIAPRLFHHSVKMLVPSLSCIALILGRASCLLAGFAEIPASEILFSVNSLFLGN